MAELLTLTLDWRMPPDPAVVQPIWAAAGIKHPVPEVCRMLLLAQLAEPLDEKGWQSAALIVGTALEAVAPEPSAEPEPEPADPDPADATVFAQMAAAFAQPVPLDATPPPQPEVHDWPPTETDEAEPILIEADDVPAEGGGVVPEPEPMAEAAAPVEPDWLALIDRVEAGESIASVARSAGVDGRALGGKVTARRRLLAPIGPEAAAIPDPEPAPAEPVQVEPAPAEPAAAPVPAEPVAEDEEPSPEDGDAWTARLDLQLATLMFAGNGIKHASLKLGRSKEDCIQRYRDLMPRPGSAAQAALVKRLRAQVEAEGGHGA